MPAATRALVTEEAVAEFWKTSIRPMTVPSRPSQGAIWAAIATTASPRSMPATSRWAALVAALRTRSAPRSCCCSPQRSTRPMGSASLSATNAAGAPARSRASWQRARCRAKAARSGSSRQRRSKTTVAEASEASRMQATAIPPFSKTSLSRAIMRTPRYGVSASLKWHTS
jgi:hypothetical protein